MRMIPALLALLSSLALVPAPVAAQGTPIGCTSFSGFPLSINLGRREGAAIVGSESAYCANGKIMAAVNAMAAQRGVANGIATLGPSGLLPLTQFPAANTVTPTASGRKAVDLGDASDLSVATPGFPGGQPLTSWLRYNRTSLIDLGTVDPTAATDSTAAVNTRLAALKATGGRMTLNAGKFLSSGWLLDYSGQTADVPDDSRQVSLEGDGIGNTVVYANTPNTYGLKVLGGLAGAANSLVYSPVGNFTMARRAQARTGSRGLWLSGIAFGRFPNLYLTDLEIPLYFESSLSTVFDNLIIASSTNGIQVAKGAGFTNSNSNTFNNPQFRLIDKWAVSGGPITAWTMNGLGMQGVGTQGDLTTGGMNLTFNGDGEGASGLTLNGGYVENNSGDADFVLTNTGSREVTHVFTGVTFSRISASKFTRTHIKLVGKNKVICVGCAFAAYNDYVVSASRPIVDYDPTQSTFQCIGCSGLGKADGAGISNGPRQVYRGVVSDTGTLTQLEGTGLTLSKAGTGDYVLTHGFGDTSSWTIQVTSVGVNTVAVERAVRGNTTAEVLMRAPGGPLADGAFNYEIVRY